VRAGGDLRRDPVEDESAAVSVPELQVIGADRLVFLGPL